jgi:MFS family permease
MPTPSPVAPQTPLAKPGLNDWLVAILVAVCYALAYLDRQVISLLIKPIEMSLHITDTQFGLLNGVSFSLFYVAASYPLACLADRTRRSWVMSGSVAFWSAMTVACGFVVTFPQLMAMRIGVAMGEAGLTPAALATLADRFDRRRLAVATSLFMLAPFAGGGLALGIGGALYAWARTLSPASLLPRLGFQDWQVVFLIVGAGGIVPALLLMATRDRRQRGAASEAGATGIFALFAREWRIYLLYPAAMGLVMVVLASYVTWLPAAIMRSKGIDEVRTGALFGPIYLASGVAGTLLAGLFVRARAGTNPVRTVLLYMLAMLVMLWPVAIYGVLTSSLTAELGIMGLALFLISSVTSLSSLPYQYLTPGSLRAQAMALMAMVTALMGTGLGPILTGFLSDRLPPSHFALSIALAMISGVCVPGALALLALVLRQHERRRLDLATEPAIQSDARRVA